MARTNNRKPVSVPKKTPNLSEIGTTGLSEFSGRIQEDFLRELRGTEGYKRYNEMRLNSPIVGGMLSAVEQSIRGITWSVTSDAGDEDERIAFIEENLEGLSHSWNDHIVEVLTMLPFGFSLFEICYKRDERKRIMWDKFAIRGQETVWQWGKPWSKTVDFEGVKQQLNTTFEVITLPIEKLLLYRTRVERNNPEGRSILRQAWIPYYFAKHIQQIEAIGIERDIAGLPVITLPEGADMDETTGSDYGKAAKVVRNVRNDEQAGVVKPAGWEFELLSTGGSRQFDTNEIVKRYESRMLMSALAQFLMLGQENVGSLALSKDQTDFFTMAVNSTADIISDTFTKYPIPRLLALNGYDPDGITMEHTLAGDTDTEAVGNLFQAVGAHITLDAEDENRLRKMLGLRERDVEELQAKRDEVQASKDAASLAFAQRQTTQGDDEDNMSVELYEADAPDDRKRRKREKEWEAALSQYFEGAKKRVLKAAKEMKG